MRPAASGPARPPEPSFVELYTPKLVTILREGYGRGDLRADAVAGIAVVVLASQLSRSFWASPWPARSPACSPSRPAPT